jgi:hypothetical protein
LQKNQYRKGTKLDPSQIERITQEFPQGEQHRRERNEPQRNHFNCGGDCENFLHRHHLLRTASGTRRYCSTRNTNAITSPR